MKCSLGISSFLEEISSLSHSVVFLYLFALITEEGFLISSCYSLELCIQMLISFLFSFAFRFSSFTAICKASSDRHFAFLHFFFLGMVLITASCTMSRTSIHSSSGTLYTKSNAICHLYCIIIRDLILVIFEWSSGFPYFVQFKSEFCNKEFMNWADKTVGSRSCFCWPQNSIFGCKEYNTDWYIIQISIQLFLDSTYKWSHMMFVFDLLYLVW